MNQDRPRAIPVQLSLEQLGTPLHEVTFVVLDLETTGGRPGTDMITEFGAVKVRGGELLGEFGTLVDPERGIPPEVVALTGITEAMVRDAPKLAEVLPAFLEFATGDAKTVLVAHNAPFDIGFLKAASAQLGYEWPKLQVLCTVRLARRVLSREEAPSCRLSALAALFGAAVTPNHRALDDAKATVDVLHALLERVGPLGVHSLEELLGYLPEVTAAQRGKRGLASGLPERPGVYLFRGPSEEVLYVGTATNLRRRVGQYFTAGETRARVRDMVAFAVRVDHVECAHPLEAAVRELRLLAAHRPRYNRRSTQPHRAWWITLTDEPFPRLSVVTTPREGALGPFTSRGTATLAVEAIHEAIPLRQCNQRIPARNPQGRPCILAELDRCAAPCAGHQSPEDYAPAVHAMRALVAGHDDAPVRLLLDQLGAFATTERFEQAGLHRDRIAGLLKGLDRGQRLTALAAIPEFIAARPDGAGGWLFAIVRHGRLASAGSARRGVAPMPVVEALVLGAETVLPGPGPLFGAPAEEVRVILRWVEQPGTRLVRAAEPWRSPARGAARWREWLERAEAGRQGYAGAD
ncbi:MULTISPECIES: DEDD exonuclease domain-containing protein [unclassified Crossiella]|uniref:DEDD exonuclease domain-containing protein n=1 Tax=unclassified Crossiella TaxID=2620835 RepID=UPI001FFEF079|nr:MULTISPECIES: DEDD exonuclease domain-containing protein [unclassified Crossiella]MCK2240123.1 DEDD exonuclease domain-containing protein [Crossiella sp. S99.2]MCK2253425.1 DEDD exonuclease domain-containing protein [Crossiella sp. S99.1]